MRQMKCTKHFPNKYNDKTTFYGFPIYKTRNTGIEVNKNDPCLDNRYVVPYNRNLLVQFDAHLNVETCNYSKSVKYLFKYVHKGCARETSIIESTNSTNDKYEI